MALRCRAAMLRGRRSLFLLVQADRCDGPRYYHAVRGSGRLTQVLGRTNVTCSMLARCGMSVFLVPHHSASLHVWPACALVHFSGWSALVVPARVGAAPCASCAPRPCATREVTQVCSNAQPCLGHPQRRPQLPGLFARLHSRRYCSFRRAFVFLRPNNSFNATVTCRADNPAPSAAR